MQHVYGVEVYEHYILYIPRVQLYVHHR